MNMDAFAALGLPRRAALAISEIREAFQKAGALAHPDGASGDPDQADRTEAFTRLSEAHTLLSSVPRRLRHLLELTYPETAAAKTGAVMDGLMMDLFSTTGSAVQRAAAVQAKKQKASSALTKAMLAGEEMQAQENLEAATQKVEAAHAILEADLAAIDAAMAAGKDAAAALQSAAARAGFLEKWQAQLRAAFAGFFAA